MKPAVAQIPAHSWPKDEVPAIPATAEASSKARLAIGRLTIEDGGRMLDRKWSARLSYQGHHYRFDEKHKSPDTATMELCRKRQNAAASAKEIALPA